MKKKITFLAICLLLVSTLFVACRPAELGQTTAPTTQSTVSATEPTVSGPEETISAEPSASEETRPVEQEQTEPIIKEESDQAIDSTEDYAEHVEPNPTEDVTSSTEEQYEMEFDVKITIVNEPIYAKRFVNVRTGPGTQYEKVGSMDLGDSATRIGIGDNGWSKIVYNGQEYYSFSEYLTTEMPLAADPNHKHNYKSQVVHPTCAKNGYTLHECICGKYYKDNTVDKLQHSYSVSEIIQPTCTEEGYTIYVCSKCEASYKGDKTGIITHQYSEKIIAPTCTSEGYTLHTCTACKHEMKANYTDKLPHDYKSNRTIDQTCTNAGYVEYKCTSCGHTYQEDNNNPALGHDFSVKKDTQNATCESGGHTEYKCSRCSEIEKRDVTSALGHNYATETIAPTKDTNGYDIHTCSRCGNSYKDNYTDPAVYYKEVNETVYANKAVNIRKGPGTSYEKLGSLNYGQSITRVGIGENGWSKVLHNDEIAYMYSEYLQTTKPADISSSGWPKTYSDGTCTITIYREWYKKAWCYAAHIQFTDYTRLGTDCANGAYNNGRETTSHAARRLGAIFAVNGCYSSPNLDYTVVRHGKIWNGSGRERFWCPAVYSYHNGKLLSAWDSQGTPGISGGQIDKLVADGLVTDTFCFGPPSLVNGVVLGTNEGARAQRTMIGTNGNPGDIWIVVSDGRYNDGESAGLTFYEGAEYLKSKGCTFGVHLDGGGSSTMYFNGKVLNAANGNQRSVVDFVYFK